MQRTWPIRCYCDSKGLLAWTGAWCYLGKIGINIVLAATSAILAWHCQTTNPGVCKMQRTWALKCYCDSKGLLAWTGAWCYLGKIGINIVLVAMSAILAWHCQTTNPGVRKMQRTWPLKCYCNSKGLLAWTGAWCYFGSLGSFDVEWLWNNFWL